jgi:proteic killer suppression protein
MGGAIDDQGFRVLHRWKRRCNRNLERQSLFRHPESFELFLWLRMDALRSRTICPATAYTKLKGNRAGTWSVTVNGNWRVTFSFEGEDTYEVDLEGSLLRIRTMPSG